MQLRDIFRISVLLFIFSFQVQMFAGSPVLSSDGVLSYTGATGLTDVVNLSISGDETTLIVDITSDGIANQYTYAIGSVGQFRFVSKEMMMDAITKAPNLNLHVETVHYEAIIGRIFEMEAMFNLVKYVNVTHTTVQSGNWSDPDTWGGVDKIPLSEARVLIEAGHVITIDGVFNENYRTIRVDGTIRFATDKNTSLKVQTMVINNKNVDGLKGRFEMGTELDPIQDAYTARLIIDKLSTFEVTDTSSPDYDPHKLGLGLIAHGEVSIYGKKKTGYATFNGTPSGVNSITLDKVPADWEVGDHIVIAGVQIDADGDEARVISGIGGNTISFQQALTKSHITPTHTKSGLTLKVHVINTTRNAILETVSGLNRVEKIGDEFIGRGHVMFMHTNNVSVHYGGFYHLGRTNKQGVMHDVRQDKNTGAILRIANNPIARYPVHFHRAGNDTSPGIIKGTAVVNSPGWGYVNHRSNAIIEDNVAYDVSGASFISEAGDEEGTFKNNVSIRSIGNGLENFAGKLSFLKDIDKVERNITNFGSAGDGFWIHSRLVEVENNVASGFTGNGLILWNEAIDGIIPLPADGSIPSNSEEQEPSYIQKAIYFKDNLCYGGLNGLNFSFVSASEFGGQSQVVNQVCYNITYGVRKKYDTSIIIDNAVLIGNLEHPVGEASKSHSNGHSIIFLNPHAEGFLNGLDFEHRKESAGVLEGGYFNNVNNIRINIRHDREQNIIFNKDIVFGTLSPQAIANVVADNIPGFTGSQYNFYGYSDNASKKDDGFVDNTPPGGPGKASNMLIQQTNGNYKKTYLQTEQNINFIPWPSPNTDVDPNWLDKTNGELQVLLGTDPVLYKGAVFSKEYYDNGTVEIPLVNEKYFNVVLGPETSSAKFIPMYVRDSIVDLELKINTSIVLDITDVVYDPNLFGVTYNIKSNSNTGFVTAAITGDNLTLNGLALGTSIIEVKGTNISDNTQFVIDTFEVTIISNDVSLIALDDTFDINYNTVTDLTVLENDSWTEGYNTTIVALTQGANGNTSINPDGTINYAPALNYSGVDSFTYTLEDVYGTQVTATVNILVNPLTPDYAISVEQGQSVLLDILTNVDSATNGADGNTSFSGTEITYTETNATHDGTDEFTYTIGASTGTVSITILPEAIVEVPFQGPEVLFYDGFESGDLATENWTLGDPGTTKANVPTSSYKVYKGAKSARVSKGTYIQNQFSTIDYHDIIVSFYRKTKLNEKIINTTTGETVTGNYFESFWSIDGSTWYPLEARIENSVEWGFARLELPPAANNQAAVYIKFDIESQWFAEKATLDEVLATGTPTIGGVIPTPEITVVNQVNGSVLIFEGAINTDIEKSLTIKNVGNGDLVLENFQISGVNFSIQNNQLPSVLKPTNSTVVRVVASSISNTPESGTLTFTSNDVDESNYFIDLITASVVLGDDDPMLEGRLVIYPNPTNGVINFGGTQKENIDNIDVFNIAGQRILHKKINEISQLQNFDLSNLSKGVYYLRIYSKDNNITTIKLLVNNK